MSKRVRVALDQMSGDPDAPSTSELEVVEKKKPRKRKEKEVKEKSDGEESPVKRPTRTRKRQNDEPIAHCSKDAADDDGMVKSSSSFEAGTSTTTGKSKKKVVLPDNNEPIPQREKDKQAMEHNKLKAIEILKKRKK